MTKDDEKDVTPAAEEETSEVDVTEPAADDESDADTADADTADAERDRERGRLRRMLVPVALAVLLLASAGVTTWAYLALYKTGQQTNDAVATQVMQAASDGTVALLSYSPETLDKDFANAKTKLTGDFLTYYTQFTQDIVTPAAQEKSVRTSAVIVRSAMERLQPASADVLLFLNQSTISKENPDGAFTASSVKVELTKVGDAWLISSFDPV